MQIWLFDGYSDGGGLIRRSRASSACFSAFAPGFVAFLSPLLLLNNPFFIHERAWLGRTLFMRMMCVVVFRPEGEEIVAAAADMCVYESVFGGGSACRRLRRRPCVCVCTEDPRNLTGRFVTNKTTCCFFFFVFDCPVDIFCTIANAMKISARL